jgi:hypothetical protein
MASTFTKDPDAVLDYQFDWSDWLTDGDTIQDASVTATAGLTVAPDLTVTATAVTCWLSGGTAGLDYTVTCHIETAGGRVDERSIKVQVRER